MATPHTVLCHDIQERAEQELERRMCDYEDDLTQAPLELLIGYVLSSQLDDLKCFINHNGELLEKIAGNAS